jgi:tetratricopeptide (TPR) repeat protein
MAKRALTVLLLSLASVLTDVTADDTVESGYISESDDAAYRYFATPDLRYYLIVTVDKSTVAGTDLPFAINDGRRMAELLEKIGYSPLPTGTGSAILSGKTATAGTFTRALEAIQMLPETAEVVVHYSGHGVMEESREGKHLWLQMFGQDHFGPGAGVSFVTLMHRARGTTFDGGLAVLLDTCFSGAIKFDSMTLNGLGASTVVLASSLKESGKIDLDDGASASAFAYVVWDGMTNHWYDIDENADGFVTYDELALYAKARLGQLHDEGKVLQAMVPQTLANDQRVFAYDRSKVRRWRSNVRSMFLRTKLLAALLSSPVRLDLAGGIPKTLVAHTQHGSVAWASSISEVRDGRFTTALAKLVLGDAASAQKMLAEITPSERAGEIAISSEAELLARAVTAVANNDYATAADGFARLAKEPSYLVPRRWTLEQAGTTATIVGDYSAATAFYAEVENERQFMRPPFAPLSRKNLLAEAGVVESNRASLLFVKGDRRQAEKSYRRSITYLEEAGSIIVADVTADLGDLYQLQGKFAEAAALFKRSIASREKSFRYDAALVEDLQKYSAALAKLGNRAEAKAAQEKIKKVTDYMAIEKVMALAPGGFVVPQM